MKLYQNRDFNSFFQDTFTFLKEHGKHFFTFFFTVSGALIILLAIVSYYVTKTYTAFKELVMMKVGQWKWLPRPESIEIVKKTLLGA